MAKHRKLTPDEIAEVRTRWPHAHIFEGWKVSGARSKHVLLGIFVVTQVTPSGIVLARCTEVNRHTGVDAPTKLAYPVRDIRFRFDPEAGALVELFAEPRPWRTKTMPDWARRAIGRHAE